MLNEVSLHVVGASVTAIVKREPTLAECRSLNAIHLATVLDLRDHSDGGIRMATFDIPRVSTRPRVTACFGLIWPVAPTGEAICNL